MDRLGGSFYFLLLYDISEQIDLTKLTRLIRAEPTRREPSFKHPAPDYVRFERAPVVESGDPLKLSSGESFDCRFRYFDYGVLCVELKLPFDASWDELIQLSSRWVNSPELERVVSQLVEPKIAKIAPALVEKYASNLSEDYYIIHVETAAGQAGAIAAQEMVFHHGGQIAQILRGEPRPLADGEVKEVLDSRLSYYPTDLLVAGWVGAFLYDTEEGGQSAIQLLEYANAQLLEFRHYDELLTRVLERVYDQLGQKGGPLRRWRMARQAERLNAVRLEITEIAERADTSIKFLSDMFYARAYRVAAARIGVNDYRFLVEEKLRTAGDLYRSMVDEFHQTRAFILEVMVVAILVIELIHLFRGGFR
jgi:hypothetical protein